MPYVSALENILREIDIGVDNHLEMSNYVFKRRDSQKSSKRYTSDSIDRIALPHIDINSISYIKDQHLDVVLQGMFQKYSIAIQESRERALLDDSFNRADLDKELNSAMSKRYGAGLLIFYATSAIVATMGLARVLDPTYPGMPPIMGSVIAAPLTLIEHWGGNPLGKLLMSTYTNSKTLGTRYYEDKVKHQHFKKILKYVKKYAPELLKEKETSYKKPIPVLSKEKVLNANVFSN